MDFLYLAQWLGCLAALAGGTAVLWSADDVRGRPEPGRWIATGLGVLLLVTVLGLWLGSTGVAADPVLVDRADRLTDGVQLVALTFLVLFHTLAPRSGQRWYCGGATLLTLGFGTVLSAGAQVSFPQVAWSATAWLQLGLFLGAGAAMHAALAGRAPELRHSGTRP